MSLASTVSRYAIRPRNGLMRTISGTNDITTLAIGVAEYPSSATCVSSARRRCIFAAESAMPLHQPECHGQRDTGGGLRVAETSAGREWSGIRRVARETATTAWQHGHLGFI